MCNLQMEKNSIHFQTTTRNYATQATFDVKVSEISTEKQNRFSERGGSSSLSFSVLDLRTAKSI